jgi:uncharacterized protein YggE
MLLRTSTYGIVCLCILLVNNISLGQQPMGLVAGGSGFVSVKPEKLRLLMQVKAQGKDAKAAILALSSHKERVKKELETMKADTASIVFSSTAVSSGSDDEESAQMRRMQMQMRRANGGEESGGELPSIVTASCVLRAEWPLPVQEGDALAILPTTLREQLASRDIAGDKNKPEWSEAEQEKLEEMETMLREEYGFFSSDSEGERVRIDFIADASDEDVKTAIAEAYKRATGEASSLAAATGVKLGKLKGLTNSSNLDQMESYPMMRYQYSSGVPAILAQLQNEKSIASDSADGLKVAASVTLVYEIE